MSRFYVFRLSKFIVLLIAQKFRQLLSSRHPLSGQYKWISQSNLENTVSNTLIFPTERIHLKAPSFIGFGDLEAFAKTPSRDVLFPDINIFLLKDSVAVGGVDFVFLKNLAIHHDLFLPNEHHCPAENLGIIQVPKHDKRFVYLRLNKPSINIPKAISLLGQCSTNYAHWLTETLPKLAIVDSCDLYNDFPLLIDEGLHANILESLHTINKNNREIIIIKRWSSVKVRELIVISTPGYERYSPQGLHNKEAKPYINKFSKSSLHLLRQMVINSIHSDSVFYYPKKIYLARSKSSKNLRQILNIDAIEFFLDDQQVERINSDQLSFVEQVKACMNAELIVCPIGAALTNMIFAPPGCKIICLSPYYDDANYFYYTNLAATLGHQMNFVLGPQAPGDQHPMHKSYSIDIDLIKTFLN